MSYQAIIADDEPKIIQLIRHLGHWEELGIEIVDECRTGKEAYESILKNRPDFVLSDIKMPVYDGLELIRMVREAGLDPLFVLLSGYRHFEYARSAVSLNVMDYLLKPVDEGQLNETLREVCIRLDERRERRLDRESLSAFRADQNRRELEQFWSCVLGDPQEHARTLRLILDEETCNRNFHTEFTRGCYQILQISTSLGAILGDGDTISTGRVSSYIEEAFAAYARVYDHHSYRGYVLILNFPAANRQKIHAAISALYYKIRDLREIYGEIRVSIGCSRVKENIRELYDASCEACCAEWGRLVLTRGGVLDYDQIAVLPHFHREELMPDGEIQKLCDCVRYLRGEEFGDLFEELYRRAGKYNNANPQDMLESFFALQGQLLSCISDEKKRQRMEEESYLASANSKSFQQVFRDMFRVWQKYIEEEQKQLKEKMGKPIQLAVQFIKERYASQISLEDTAEAANISPTYLSKLFKTEMGLGFNEFLTQIRLEESERLLAQTALSIREIAAAVGYVDEKYYSKLFKKQTGIRPTDYRRIYS